MRNYAEDLCVTPICIIETGGIDKDNTSIIQFDGFRYLDNTGARLESAPNAKVRTASEINE